MQIAESTVETPRSDDNPSKRVIVCTLQKGEKSFSAEACLDVCKKIDFKPSNPMIFNAVKPCLLTIYAYLDMA